MPSPILLIHGGADLTARSRAEMTPDAAAEFRAGLKRALLAGHRVLSAGGSALDAVVVAVEILEDDPQFNAGKGAVFTHEGKIELDASIMDGRSGLAGAVAGVTTIRHPIAAARCVMEKSSHVLLAGPGAEDFAKVQGLEIVPPAFFYTDHRWRQLQQALAEGQVILDHEGAAGSSVERTIGTVGAVALDREGHLAAGTSTGGMTNKLFGRIGDSPIIGAGTYADDATVAVSCTGTGEFFMRGVMAYDVAARMKYLKGSLGSAVEGAIRAALDAKGGRGGLIAVDAAGNTALQFNSEGMFRGSIDDKGEPSVAIFED